MPKRPKNPASTYRPKHKRQGKKYHPAIESLMPGGKAYKQLKK